MNWDAELQKARTAKTQQEAAKAQQEAAARQQQVEAESQRRRAEADLRAQSERKLADFERNVGVRQALDALNRMSWGGRGAVSASGGYYSLKVTYLLNAELETKEIFKKRWGKHTIYHQSPLAGKSYPDHDEWGSYEVYIGTQIVGVRKRESIAEIRITVAYNSATDSYSVQGAIFPATPPDWNAMKAHIATLIWQQTTDLLGGETVYQREQHVLAEASKLQAQVGQWTGRVIRGR